MVDLLVLGFIKLGGILHDQENEGICGNQRVRISLEALSRQICRKAVSYMSFLQKGKKRKRSVPEAEATAPTKHPKKGSITGLLTKVDG